MLQNVLVLIDATQFQKFDHNEIIEQWISPAKGLSGGDKFYWECGCNLSGTAEVMNRKGTVPRGSIYTIKKVS